MCYAPLHGLRFLGRRPSPVAASASPKYGRKSAQETLRLQAFRQASLLTKSQIFFRPEGRSAFSY